MMGKLLISDQGGRSNVLSSLKDIGFNVDKDDSRIADLLNIVKEREAAGYTYESAQASFELLARSIFGKSKDFFNVESFRTLVERRNNAKGELITVSEATVKLEVDGERFISSGEGNGPVNAIDNALGKSLMQYVIYLKEWKLNLTIKFVFYPVVQVLLRVYLSSLLILRPVRGGLP